MADRITVELDVAPVIARLDQILRKLASYPRQNELATALREVGRVERTLRLD